MGQSAARRLDEQHASPAAKRPFPYKDAQKQLPCGVTERNRKELEGLCAALLERELGPLAAGAVRVFLAVLEVANWRNGRCDSTVAHLATVAHVSVPTCYRALRRLEELRIIRIQRTRPRKSKHIECTCAVWVPNKAGTAVKPSCPGCVEHHGGPPVIFLAVFDTNGLRARLAFSGYVLVRNRKGAAKAAPLADSQCRDNPLPSSLSPEYLTLSAATSPLGARTRARDAGASPRGAGGAGLVAPLASSFAAEHEAPRATERTRALARPTPAPPPSGFAGRKLAASPQSTEGEESTARAVAAGDVERRDESPGAAGHVATSPGTASRRPPPPEVTLAIDRVAALWARLELPGAIRRRLPQRAREPLARGREARRLRTRGVWRGRVRTLARSAVSMPAVVFSTVGRIADFAHQGGEVERNAAGIGDEYIGRVKGRTCIERSGSDRGIDLLVPEVVRAATGASSRGDYVSAAVGDNEVAVRVHQHVVGPVLRAAVLA